MEKYIPYGKLSEKEKRKIDSQRRGTWGNLNPATRKPANIKAYNRSKSRNWKRDYHEPIPGFYCIIFAVFSPWLPFPGTAPRRAGGRSRRCWSG